MGERAKVAGRPGFGGQFRVFKASGHTQIPNEMLDELVSTLSGAEVKVLLYVARRTFGFHRQAARISFGQLCNGLVLADGRRLDHGTGLARSTAQAAVKSLEAAGLLVVRRVGKVGAPGMGLESNTYTLLVEGEDGRVMTGDGDPMPEIGIGGRGGYVENRHGGMPKNGIGSGGVYRKERKGKKAPYNPPGENTGKKAAEAEAAAGETGIATAADKCPECNGYGVYVEGEFGVKLYVVHDGTAYGVRSVLARHSTQYPVGLCGCPVGANWREFLADMDELNAIVNSPASTEKGG